MTFSLTAPHVARWFEQYGATLDDATSFRIQMEAVTREVAEIEKLIPSFEAANLTSEVAEARADIAEAKALIEKMQARLDVILATPKPA